MDGLIITTNVWPTDNKQVAVQIAQFGMENLYDITITDRKCKHRKQSKIIYGGWGLPVEAIQLQPPISLEQIYALNLKILISFRVEFLGVHQKGLQVISATDMTEAIYDQKPFDPEQNGADFKYTITWNLKAL